jgi:hypothetical protein
MGPMSFRIQIMDPKMWPASTKTGVPYNFCFIKFLPNRMAEATEARQILFRAPLTPGVGVWSRILAMNLLPIEEYTHAKFHWDWSSGLDFYSGHTQHTHWLLYIGLAGATWPCPGHYIKLIKCTARWQGMWAPKYVRLDQYICNFYLLTCELCCAGWFEATKLPWVRVKGYV